VIIICLDQCAISNLAKSKGSSGDLGKIKQTLIEGAERLDLICPIANETIVETTGLKSAEQRIDIYELHTTLADARLGGPHLAFKNMWKMIDEETLALARSEPPPFAFELFQWRRIEDDQLASDTWRGVVEDKQRMLERVKAHAAKQTSKPKIALTKKGFALADEHAAHVCRQVERLMAGQDPDERDHMGFELALYLREKGITRAELEKLKQDIRGRRWESIPVIFNRTQLTAQLEADFYGDKSPRNYNVNDEIDIPRLAVGLWSADMIITDSAMAQLCRSVKTERWPSAKAKVFSIRETTAILDYLEASREAQIAAR